MTAFPFHPPLTCTNKGTNGGIFSLSVLYSLVADSLSLPPSPPTHTHTAGHTAFLTPPLLPGYVLQYTNDRLPRGVLSLEPPAPHLNVPVYTISCALLALWYDVMFNFLSLLQTCELPMDRVYMNTVIVRTLSFASLTSELYCACTYIYTPIIPNFFLYFAMLLCMVSCILEVLIHFLKCKRTNGI